MGVARGEASRESDHREKFRDPAFHLVLMQAVNVQHFFQSLLHRESGVQRGKRVLKDELDLSRERAVVAVLAQSHGLSVDLERSRGGCFEANQESRQRGLSTPALSHDAEGLTSLEG